MSSLSPSEASRPLAQKADTVARVGMLPVCEVGMNPDLQDAIAKVRVAFARGRLTPAEFADANDAFEQILANVAEVARPALPAPEPPTEPFFSQRRCHDAAATEVKRRGFEEGRLQLLWRTPECFTRTYDQHEVGAAICEALTREGCTAWWGDGTSCVEQMIRLQWDRAMKAETELAALRGAALPAEHAPPDPNLSAKLEELLEDLEQIQAGYEMANTAEARDLDASRTICRAAIHALFGSRPALAGPDETDLLAQDIRAIDGNHTLGAGALRRKINRKART